MSKQSPKPKKSPRIERRQQRTRTALIAAARRITAEKGVDGMTIRDLADEVDIAMGSFYTYFETKDELLMEVVQEISLQTADLIDDANSVTTEPLRIIATAIYTLDSIVYKDPILGWFVVRMSVRSQNLMSGMRDRFIRDITLGCERGDFSIPNIPIAANSFAAALLAFFRGRLTGKILGKEVPDFVHLMLRLFGAKEEAARATADDIWQSRVEKEEKKN
jgi:AcrR family transcriptional regulator